VSNKKLLFLLPLILFVAMVILLFTGLGKDPTKLESQLIGKDIPKFNKTLLLQAEKLVTEKNISGPALINIFGSWCPSCYHEHPYLMQLSTEHNIKIYGLNYNDKRAAGAKFINDLGNPYEFVIFDDNGRLRIDLGVYGAPETFVVNSENKIVYRHVGIVNEAVWLKLLKPKMYPDSNKSKGKSNG
jgi:cytochrome c biogenesis protein CcmG, thiol:disulfide interchange protein DsbE